MNKSPLVILYGGKSTEHDVSLLSAASVVRHAPYSDAELVLIGIDRSGIWHLQSSDMVKSVRAGKNLEIQAGPVVGVVPGTGFMVQSDTGTKLLDCACVFPVLHGTNGEDGTVQGFLEVAGLPYVGSGILGSALGMDKEKVKLVWQALGLPVLPFETIRADMWKTADPSAMYHYVEQKFGPTVFVKPARGGSSVGIGKASTPSEFEKAVSYALTFDTKVLIEPAVTAREIETSVTGHGTPASWAVGEIVPHHDFYDYDAKYLDPDGAGLVVPADLAAERAQEVKSIAEQAYIACEASGLARVDFFLDKESGRLWLNEINTLPGFTNVSMFPMMCEAGGLAYSDLIAHLVELAVVAHEEKTRLSITRN